MRLLYLKKIRSLEERNCSLKPKIEGIETDADCFIILYQNYLKQDDFCHYEWGIQNSDIITKLRIDEKTIGKR